VEQIVAAILGCLSRNFSFEVGDELEGALHQFYDVLTLQVALDEEVVSGEASHWSPVDDAVFPHLVISSGVAGGANINLNVTEVVAATDCVYHDAYCGDECEYGQILGMPALFKTPKEYVEKALAINELPDNQHPKIHAGQIVSGEWFVDSKEKMRSILEHFPHAMAVDMESCSIAQTCHIYKTPFISFRIISDVPLKDTKAQQYFDFWAKMAEGSFNVTKAFLESL
jgi:adenosylhomocysteine nucleosidase